MLDKFVLRDRLHVPVAFHVQLSVHRFKLSENFIEHFNFLNRGFIERQNNLFFNAAQILFDRRRERFSESSCLRDVRDLHNVLRLNRVLFFRGERRNGNGMQQCFQQSHIHLCDFGFREILLSYFKFLRSGFFRVLRELFKETFSEFGQRKERIDRRFHRFHDGFDTNRFEIRLHKRVQPDFLHELLEVKHACFASRFSKRIFIESLAALCVEQMQEKQIIPFLEFKHNSRRVSREIILHDLERFIVFIRDN